jgi:hypothetical protein
MVMRLHLHNHAKPIANIHDSGVLHSAGLHVFVIFFEETKDGTGIFVATVLGPHNGIHADFGDRWLTAEDFKDALKLRIAQAHVAINFRIDHDSSIPFLIKRAIRRGGRKGEEERRNVNNRKKPVVINCRPLSITYYLLWAFRQCEKIIGVKSVVHSF